MDYEKYLRMDKFPMIFCPGCGEGNILKAILRAIDRLGLDKLTCAAIERRVQHYNETAPAGSFQLSFSTGVAKYEGGSVEKFLVELDQRMYAEKRAFHAARDGHAAPEQGNAPSI